MTCLITSGLDSRDQLLLVSVRTVIAQWLKKSKIISLMKCQMGGRTSFESELWRECVLRGPWAWVWMGSMYVWESQLWSMRIDLARGQERCSTTATEAAEIDFMNIKQQGVDTRTRLLQSTQGHAMVGLHIDGYIRKDIFFCRMPKYLKLWYSNSVINSHKVKLVMSYPSPRVFPNCQHTNLTHTQTTPPPAPYCWQAELV